MIRYLGLDVHKSYIHGCEWRVDEQREWHFRFPNTRDGLERLVAELDASCRVALEVTGSAFEVYDVLAPHAGQVILANPVELKRLGSGRHTDRVDAARLAKMLALGTLAPVWVPPVPLREVRRLLRYRQRLVTARGRSVNQAKAILRRRGVALRPRVDPRRVGQADELKRLPDADRWMLHSLFRQMQLLDEEIVTCEVAIAQRIRDEPLVKLLLTIPGVGIVTAAAIWAFLGDPRRFRKAKQVARYAGLDPSVHQSGERDTRGRISKNGCSLLRSVLVEAALLVARYDVGPLGAFYRRLRGRIGHKRAIVAVARKLLTVAWRMMLRGEPYRAGKPDMTAHKHRKLARLAALVSAPTLPANGPRLSASQARPAKLGAGDHNSRECRIRTRVGA